MKFLVLLAWRNLQCNRQRSLVSGMTIFISALILLNSFFLGDGITDGMVQKLVAIESGTVFITYDKEADTASRPDMLLKTHKRTLEALAAIGDVKQVRSRLRFDGMLFGPGGESFMLALKGIDPEAERELLEYLPPREGRSISADGDEILISQTVADALRVQAGDKITLVSNTWGNEVNALDLTVAGIFANVAPWVDYVAYTSLKTARNLFAENIANQYLVDLSDLSEAALLAGRIENALEGEPLSIETYRSAGGFQLGIASANRYSFIAFSALLLSVVGMGIASMMGITVRERSGELGTLLAIGFQTRQLMILLITEVAILVVLATSAAIGVGLLIYLGLSYHGIALEGVARNAFGTATLRPAVHPYQFVALISTCLIMGMGGAFFPALRVFKLQPDEILTRG